MKQFTYTINIFYIFGINDFYHLYMQQFNNI